MASRKKKYMVGDVIGDYRLTEECGGGGFGQVFLAENTVSGLPVALKTLKPEFGDKELDGLKAFQQCKNEHLIQIHHIGKTESGLLYYTMDRADNAGTSNKYEADSLEKRIRKNKISPDEIFDLAIHMAEALGTLHEKGLIHRDVKPANIIFVDKKPVLADIGLVTNAERPDVSLAGTAGFLPKYVYAGGHPQCAESDFYALGIVLLCALTGQCNPQKALDCNASMTLSGHSGDLQRVCATLEEDGKNFEDIEIHSSKDFLDCLKSEDVRSNVSQKQTRSGKTSSKSTVKQKNYHDLLEELFEDSIYTAPDIPDKKLKNALRSFAPGVEPKDVLLLADDTVFGSAKEGLIITRDAVYGKESWECPRKIQLFKNTTVSVKGSKVLCINNYDFITLTQHKDHYSKLAAVIRAVCASRTDFSENVIKPEIFPRQKMGCLKKILIFAAFWILLGLIGNWLEEKEQEASKQSTSAADPKAESQNTEAIKFKDSKIQELLDYFPEHPQMKGIIQTAKNRSVSGAGLTDKDRMADLVWLYDEEKDVLLAKIADSAQEEVPTDVLRELAQLLWQRTKMMIFYLEFDSKSDTSAVRFDDAGFTRVTDYLYTSPLDDLRIPENENHPVFKAIFTLLARFADSVPEETEKIIDQRIEAWKRNHNSAPKTDICFILFKKYHAQSLQKIRMFFRKYKHLKKFNEAAQRDYYEIGMMLHQRNIALKNLESLIKQEEKNE